MLFVGLIGGFDTESGLIAPFPRPAENPRASAVLSLESGRLSVASGELSRRKRKIFQAEFLLRQECSKHETQGCFRPDRIARSQGGANSLPGQP